PVEVVKRAENPLFFGIWGRQRAVSQHRPSQRITEAHRSFSFVEGKGGTNPGVAPLAWRVRPARRDRSRGSWLVVEVGVLLIAVVLVVFVLVLVGVFAAAAIIHGVAVVVVELERLPAPRPPRPLRQDQDEAGKLVPLLAGEADLQVAVGVDLH